MKRFSYKPFIVRRIRTNIEFVRLSQGKYIPTGLGPRGSTISYDQFLLGEMPTAE